LLLGSRGPGGWVAQIAAVMHGMLHLEHQLMEQLDYNLLFRWFVGPPVLARTASRSVGSDNRATRRTFNRRREVRGFGLAQVGELHSAPTRWTACGRGLVVEEHAVHGACGVRATSG
ncbi:MAG: hypothetical protein OXQ29_23140, partial [Rhodospirillaceae bacterium]|nr:hypothetical protein [Rhodospirillaceae bacterium]